MSSAKRRSVACSAAKRPIQVIEKQLRPLIREFCNTSAKWVTQPRLRAQFFWSKQKSKKKSSNAAKARWNKEKIDSERICERNASKSKSKSKKKEEEESFSPILESPKEAADKYEFESGVIQLNKNDFEKWSDAFSHLDLKAELIALAPWAEKQRNWFDAVSGALAKRNREIKTAIASAAQTAALEKARPLTDQERRAKIARETGIL